MVEYIIIKGTLRDISCKMRDAVFDVSFRDCPAKGGTGGHPIVQYVHLTRLALNERTKNKLLRQAVWCILLRLFLLLSFVLMYERNDLKL
jgi:hypothetical protein